MKAYNEYSCKKAQKLKALELLQSGGGLVIKDIVTETPKHNKE